MSFIDAMESMVEGENGELAHASSGDPRVNLFFALVRNLPDDRLKTLTQAVFDGGADDDRTQFAADFVVLAFQTRNCRGGKGERSLFIKLFLEVVERFPETALELLKLVPHFGYWKDIFLIAKAATDEGARPAAKALVPAALGLAATQLRADAAEVAAAKAADRRPAGLSLCAKWAPREGSALGKLAGALAAELFPESRTARAEYRRMLSAVNQALGTVEVLMCGHEWGAIEPSKVPSLALMRTRKALLNETVKGPAPTPAERETGNRHPDDADRVACRAAVRASLLEAGAKKLNGKQLFPHEISRHCMGGGGRGGTSELELEIFDAQWRAIRTAAVDSMAEVAAKAAAARVVAGGSPVAAAAVGRVVNLGKVVPLVDVSGSMSGTPMEVAIALGILTSELADPAFAHRMITFHERPSWVRFEAGATIADKVRAAQAAPWGMSTDFARAMEMILEVCVEARLRPDQIPDLIVFSDMQFDQAGRGHGGAWETAHQRIVRRFAEAGVKACGEPWPAPEVTYWNLRGDTVGFPAAADTPGVQLLSGFSPSLLKLLLAGGALEEGDEEEEEEEGDEWGGQGTLAGSAKPKAKKDPMAAVRRALDDEAYDPVRLVLAASGEGPLAAYAFDPPPPAVKKIDEVKVEK